MANASWAAWKVKFTVTEPLATLMFWLRTTCGELSGDWSGIRSTVTFTLPLLASHDDTDDSPLKVTDAAPVYPFSSPTMATARRWAESSAAETAVVPTSPEVD